VRDEALWPNQAASGNGAMALLFMSDRLARRA